MKYCTDWIASLKGDGEAADRLGDEEEDGGSEEGLQSEKRSCNLLEALKLALELPDLDTICVLLSTK